MTSSPPHSLYRFNARLEIIGVNPFVAVPDEILQELFEQAQKNKGSIPICGTVNGRPYTQTLVKYLGEWRLYINTTMLKHAPKRIGEVIDLSIQYDPRSRAVEIPEAFLFALAQNKTARSVFDSLSPSRQTEIVRYLTKLKTEEARHKNIQRAIRFLLGEARFVGRDTP